MHQRVDVGKGGKRRDGFKPWTHNHLKSSSKKFVHRSLADCKDVREKGKLGFYDS